MESLETFWSLSMHDNHNGCVQAIAVSFDDKYIVTGGCDSNVFLYELDQKKQECGTHATDIVLCTAEVLAFAIIVVNDAS